MTMTCELTRTSIEGHSFGNSPNLNRVSCSSMNPGNIAVEGDDGGVLFV